MMHSALAWLRDQRPPGGGIRLFCLPPAGGGASAFDGWSDLLGPGIQVTAVQLPGREDRIREPAHDGLDGLLDELVPVLAGALDGPYALFGHRMGALIAYEAARRLVAQGAPPPAHLFVSAHGAPHSDSRDGYVCSLAELDFTHVLGSLSGFSAEDQMDMSVLGLLLPTLQADVHLSETYEYVDGPPLPCRLTVLVGEDDDVPLMDVALWRELTTGPFRLRMIDGYSQAAALRRRQVTEVVRGGLAGAY